MTITSRREVARILRAEAESLRRHGFTNIFSHQFACLLGQVLRPEQCTGCVLEEFVPDEVRAEAFPCQHLDLAVWERIVSLPGMPEKISERFLSVAAELEASAEVEDSLHSTD